MIEVQVWNAANDTMLGVLSRRWGVQWQDQLNGAGIGSVTVHADDPVATDSNLAHFNTVRFVYEGACRFAFRIEDRESTVVGESDTDRAIRLSGRGLLGLLADAVVYPEYGLTEEIESEREFSFVSSSSTAWYVAGDWTTPYGIRQDSWNFEATYRGTTFTKSDYPVPWPDPAAMWIWDSSFDEDADPEVPEETVWFRGSFTLDARTSVRIYATADDFFTLYLDGKKILGTTKDGPYHQWTRSYTYETILDAGTYLLSGEAVNRPDVIDENVAGFICTVTEVSETGANISILFRTNTTDWLIRSDTGGRPGWHAGQILYQLVTEAQSRNVYGADALTLGFSGLVDSDSAAWSGDTLEKRFRIGDDYLSVVAQLCEDSNLDVWVDYASMTLEAKDGRGTDRSTGSTSVALRPGESIASMVIRSDRPQATRLVVESEKGWAEQSDATAESTYGRIESQVSLGSAASLAEAEASSQRLLSTYAYPVVDATVATTDRKGPKPYVDYGVGDTILAPDGFTKGSTASYVVMTITVDEQASGLMTVALELSED